ncbi:MAG: hypothetical protein FWD04_10700 [Conexibacteraceae bacterium]|nr:hypothetical protein [Conexibacteraceae bacterium]
MPAIPEPPDDLADELVALREIADWDIPEVLIAHQDDGDLYRRLGLAKPPTGAELGRQVELAQAERFAGNAVRFTIVEPGGNDCRGRVEVDDFDWERGSAVMRVWVAPRLRGRGYEQSAAELAAGWLRAGVGLRQVDVQILS